MMMKIALGVIASALLLGAAPAFAHAQLQKAVPPVGGTVATSPSEIRLTFSEGVEIRFSTVALATETGAEIGLGRPATAPGDPTVLVAHLPKPLQAGTYEVTWHVVSVDTHKTQGSFQFTVAP